MFYQIKLRVTLRVETNMTKSVLRAWLFQFWDIFINIKCKFYLFVVTAIVMWCKQYLLSTFFFVFFCKQAQWRPVITSSFLGKFISSFWLPLEDLSYLLSLEDLSACLSSKYISYHACSPVSIFSMVLIVLFPCTVIRFTAFNVLSF